MSKSNGKSSPDVFLIIIDIFIVMFLLAFYGLGIWFIKSSFLGAGCIGIGVGMIGTGVFILIMSAFSETSAQVEYVKRYPAANAVIGNIITLPENMSFSTVVKIVEHNSEVSSDDAMLVVDDSYLYFDKLFKAGVVRVAFSDVIDWSRVDSCINLVAKYDDGVDKKSGNFLVNISSPLKLKACEQILLKNVESET